MVKIIKNYFWLEWQNTKRQGLDKVLRFIDNNDWADKNGFEKVFVSHEVLQRLFKGKFKTLQELNEASFENDQEKKYLVVTSR